MDRTLVRILSSATVLITAIFFGYEVPDRIRIDGLHTELAGLMTLMNTRYADGYSQAGFRRIRMGMSEKEVLDILGEPFYRWRPNAFKGFPEKTWYVSLVYSRPPNHKNSSFRSRAVVVYKGVVTGVFGHFVAD